MSQSRHISIEQLDKALDYLACIIDAYGDQYWPIYETLEKEYKRKLSQRQKLQGDNARLCQRVKFFLLLFTIC